VNKEEIKVLWSQFLADQTLSEEQEAQLLDALEGDAELREELIADAELAGSLQAFGVSQRGQESFARAFSDCLAAKRAETGFIRKVKARLESEKGSRGHGGGGVRHSERKPQTTRRWTSKRERFSPSPWTLALTAAVVLLAVTLFLVLSPSDPDPAFSQKARDARARASREAEQTRQMERERMDRERALAESDARRHEAEAHLREIEEKRRILAQSKPGSQEDPQAKEKREKDLEALRRDQERIEQELREAAELAKKAERQVPPAPPQEEKPSSSPVASGAQSPGTTQAVLARVEEVSGDTFLVTKEGKSPLALGANIVSTQGLLTGGGASRIVLRFPDKTRLDLGPQTMLTELKIDSGKQLALTQGTVLAVVSKQPKGEPMLFTTPHGEAKVLGTTLRLTVDPDPKKATRLEVEEGKVELKNLAGKAVYVESGHFAVAAAGVELTSKPVVAREGLKLWLKADAGVTQNRGSVSRWIDQSGSNNHALQPDPQSQPSLIAAAIHGKPTLRFNGVGSFMTFHLPINGLTGMTIFLAAANSEDRRVDPTQWPGSFLSYSALLWEETQTWGSTYVGPFQGRVSFRFGTTQSGNKPLYSRTVPIDGSYSVTAAIHEGTTDSLFVDGRPVLSEGGKRPTIQGTKDVAFLGSSSGPSPTYFPGEIAEILVYARALSESERREVEQYLMTKYARAPR
jgi:hypothetical protein